MYFGTTNFFASGALSRMMIDNQGYIGIGTTSPKGILHTQTILNTLNKFVISGDSSIASAKISSIAFNRHNYDPTGTAAEIAVLRGASTFEGNIAFSTNLGSSSGQSATERMRITNTGNVGIGTSAPAYKLEVSGDINAIGNVRANGVILTSDSRFKENITDITPSASLSIISALTPKSYTWNPLGQTRGGQSGISQYGFIAQDVESILPSIVNT
jgi:Chaperone of endosialidase